MIMGEPESLPSSYLKMLLINLKTVSNILLHFFKYPCSTIYFGGLGANQLCRTIAIVVDTVILDNILVVGLEIDVMEWPSVLLASHLKRIQIVAH